MRSSLHVLERISCSVKYNEPVLLVGETGTGKTTLVQNLAKMVGQKLTVLVWILDLSLPPPPLPHQIYLCVFVCAWGFKVVSLVTVESYP